MRYQDLAVNRQRCQEKDLSKEWDVIIQNCQEKEVSRERDVKRKGCQGEIGFKRNWCQEKVVSEKVVMPMGLWACPGLPGLY